MGWSVRITHNKSRELCFIQIDFFYSDFVYANHSKLLTLP